MRNHHHLKLSLALMLASVVAGLIFWGATQKAQCAHCFGGCAERYGCHVGCVCTGYDSSKGIMGWCVGG